MVATLASVRIHNVVAGSVSNSFEMEDLVCGAVYSQKLDRLVIMTNPGPESIISIIDPQMGTSPSYKVKLKGSSSCFAFSQINKQLVCGMNPYGLHLLNISTRRWRQFDYPVTITSISTLSNGTVVANTTGFGIQLLNLDEGHATSRQIITPTLTVHPFDEGRIIAIVPVARDGVMLLEPATMLQLLTIPTHTAVLCASLKNKMVVHCFEEGDKVKLRLWKFGGQLSEWTVEVDCLPSIGRISPIGMRLVTLHIRRGYLNLCIWDTNDGRLLAKLEDAVPRSLCPLNIMFESEDRFYSHYDDYRIPYVAIPHSHSIIRRAQTPLVRLAQREKYHVDNNHEWVVSGSQRVCWIPTGYIGSTRASHCWAGSSLVMVGHDGTLRVLTFRK
jgi:hypothetical protein